MLERWKLILSNWNNCYFSDNNTNEPALDLESLINIISHLRQNLNLDESKSSVLEAHTVKEFIEEKYPRFKFENGTVEPINDDEVYLVGSLLLYFVCINSKDVDIKSAMCSKLSSEDQKTILKFSKCLMECSEITCRDVQTAITEACGQDIAAMEVSPRPTVAETPPALRSLHSEVRRLQAALDAERFDRNYLQEELNRTNLRVEKLVKEKKQYKLDILNLKSKISLCGLEAESKDADAAADKSAKLARQLQQIEDKLVDTQAQLDDSVYERDVYKKKVEDLKRERDKFLSLSQSEAARVSQLSEELHTERRHVQSLKDLISELRQHNRLNGLDSSSLECDDPDASIHSLPHNSSVCSEACANVVEVQLGEERAKIVVLKQQIQSLQDQLNELTSKTESEIKALENIISDRENNIFDLKHRINEEIEENNNLKAHYDDDITKLNNEINELEQRLKDNSEHSRSIIEKKMQEIQALQEEKLSLLVSLNNETTKLDNTIQGLQNDLDSEKQNKSTMRENYEAQIMKLNEKVLNRNNELVELQNSIFNKGEMIEILQIDLRKEISAKDELSKQYQELNEQKKLVENELQQKISDINELQIKIQRNNTIIEDMKSELCDLHKSISDLNDKCKILEDVREVLVADVQTRDMRVEDALKEIEEITNKFSEENRKLKLDLDEMKATVHSLQTQLKNEIQFKVQLQNELDNLNSSLQQVTVLNEQLNIELTKLKTDVQDKDKTIDAMDLYLQEEKKCNAQANEKIEKLTDHVVTKEKEIKSLKEELVRINDSLLKETQTNKENFDIEKNKLLCEIAEKASLQMQVKSLEEGNVQMEHMIATKCEEIKLLQLEVDGLLEKISEKDALIKYVENQLSDECKKYDNIVKGLQNDLDLEKQNKSTMRENYEAEIMKLNEKVLNRNNELVVLQNSIFNKGEIIETLQIDLKKEISIKDELSKQYQDLIKEKELVENELQQKICDTNELQIKIQKDNTIIEDMKSELCNLHKSISDLNDKCKILEDVREILVGDVQTRDMKVEGALKEIEEITNKFIEENRKLKLDLDEMKTTVHLLQTQLKNEIQFKVQLQNELDNLNSSLQQGTVLNEQLNIELTKLKTDVQDKNKTIDAMDLYLQEEKKCNAQANEKIEKLTDHVVTKEKDIKSLKEELVRINDLLLKETQTNKESFDIEKNNLLCEIAEKESLQMQVKSLEEGNVQMENMIATKCEEIKLLQLEVDGLLEKISEKDALIKYVEKQLSDECKKYDNIVKGLQNDLDLEKQNKSTMRENYEAEIMKLNEKVLNRNNELVVLQNSIFNKGEIIETLQIDLRKEISAKDELSKQYQELNEQKELVENELQQKISDINELQIKIQRNNTIIEDLKRELCDLHKSISDLNDTCKILEDVREVLVADVQTRDMRVEDALKEIEEITKKFSEENRKLKLDLDEMKPTVHLLQTQLKNEIQLKVQLQNELVNLNSSLQQVTVLNEQLNIELTKLKTDVQDKDKTIDAMDLYLQEEKKCNEQAIEKIQKFTDHVITKEKEIKSLKEELVRINNLLLKETQTNKGNIDIEKNKLLCEITEKESLQIQVKSLEEGNVQMENVIATKCEDIKLLQLEVEGLLKKVSEKDALIKYVEKQLSDECKKYDIVESKFEVHMAKLKNRFNEMSNFVVQTAKTLRNKVIEKESTLHALNINLCQLKHELDSSKDDFANEKQKNDDLTAKLYEEILCKTMLQDKYETQCNYIESLKLQLTKEVENFSVDITEKSKAVKKLEQTIKAKNELNKKLREDNEREIQTLVDESTLLQENHSQVEKRLEEKETEVTTLEKEISTLKTRIESKDALITETTKQKDEIIESLTQELSDSKTTVNNLQQELTNLKETIVQDNNAKDYIISEMSNEKDATIKSLTQELLEKKTKNNTLQQELIKLQATIEQNNNEKDCLISEITKEKDTFINSVTQELTEEKGKLDTLQQENKAKQDFIYEITKEKDAIITSLTNELSEEKDKIDVIQQELTNLQESIEQDKKTTDAIINSLTIELADVKTKINAKQTELTNLKSSLEQCQQDNKTKNNLISEINKEKDAIINSLTTELAEEKTKINALQTELTNLKSGLEQCQQDNKAKDNLISEINKEKDAIINSLTSELAEEKTKINLLHTELTNLKSGLEQCQQDNKAKNNLISEINKEKDAIIDSLTTELAEEKTKIDALQTELTNLKSGLEQCQQDYKAKDNLITVINEEKDATINSLTTEIAEEKTKITALQTELTNLKSDLEQCQQDNKAKDNIISEINKEKDAIINSLTIELAEEKTKINTFQTELTNLKSSLELCKQDIKTKEGLISENNKEKDVFIKELSEEKIKIDTLQQENKAKDCIISKMSKEKDAIIDSLTSELSQAKIAREKSEKEAKMIFNELKNNMEVRRALMKENDQLTQAVGQQETFAALYQEKAGGEKYLCLPEPREFQVSTSSDSHSSVESLKTISDLEKIIHDKNRTITTLQSDITYMKTLMAESENKLLDVNKELEITRENLQQLSNQLKKIVYQKNEEIAELRKQVNKMSVTETRASQIIKVSSKYHAMILKRIAEIKTNTVLKELTNFGNTASDTELRRSLNAGTITMEELESFLDTTDRHLKRCAEKQIGLQKERDRLYEVNRINESEIINLKKFLNELSLSFQTFSSVKNLYAQKLSRVISVQRTVRREILNLEGRVGDVAMCKLERGYAAVLQDLAECAMNLERWVERCISRTVSVEKIKQAFTSDSERTSLSSPSFQNTGLEIQLEELEKSFQKLLDEVSNVHSDTRETQATTVMEVRAQYEDKLNRMKAKMKELMSEQMAVLKDRQRAEIGLLERELQKTRDKMEEAKRGYEAHIRELTKELWNVGEKYLVKTDEAEWLKRKQHSGSLMSLQHVHSSGLVPLQELPSRPSDAHSLRSLPVTNNTNKREGRGLHMSDEEGEVFDNRFLKEITATPRRESRAGAGGGGGKRLSELQFRNSLCPPHLKSSYPAETQFVPVLDEEEIKAGSLGPGAVGRSQRKEVGITAYKKPGPPTPSKQAGRLSATDSELRESLRVECDPHPGDRKTSTPARIRAFLSFKSRDTTEGTPRTRRLSYNIFRKK